MWIAASLQERKKKRNKLKAYDNRIVVQQQAPEFYCTEAYKYPPWHCHLCCYRSTVVNKYPFQAFDNNIF